MKIVFDYPTKIIESEDYNVELKELLNKDDSLLVICGNHHVPELRGINHDIFVMSGSGECSDELGFIREVSQKPYNTVLGIGGGSKMDLAKVARTVIAHGDISSCKMFFDEFGSFNWFPKHNVKLILIPTTSGSGSEVSRGAIFYDKATGRKRLLASNLTRADYAILDPHLTLGLSKDLTFYTGIDALSHAIESLCSTNVNTATKHFSLIAINNIVGALPGLLKYSDNLDFRKIMMYAACFAGLSLNAGVGLCHSIAHAVGAICGIPHGQAVASCLLDVMGYNRILDDGNREQMLGGLGELLLDLPKLNISRDDIPKIADFAFKDHGHRTNPVAVTYDDILELVTEIYG